MIWTSAGQPGFSGLTSQPCRLTSSAASRSASRRSSSVPRSVADLLTADWATPSMPWTVRPGASTCARTSRTVATDMPPTSSIALISLSLRTWDPA